MADALISPAVGGAMWTASAGLIAWCGRKIKVSVRSDLVPMMGVLGAFIFAAQMINFSIPGTGSSGHLGGGLILAILLGPHAAFLVITSVLTVQAFFFADGGLLALGCNIFNLGFFPAFVAYPLLYLPIARGATGGARFWCGVMIAAVAGLQLGALSVVLETRASGISDLPFEAFVLLMLPIHLAIGVVEGLATAAVVSFVRRARPEVLPDATAPQTNLRSVLVGLLVATVVVGGAVSWFASTHPDGLEWAIARVVGRDDLATTPGGVQQRLAAVQTRTAFMPDYDFKSAGAGEAPAEQKAETTGHWPAVSAGTSVAGIAGGLITLGLACGIGIGLRGRLRKA